MTTRDAAPAISQCLLEAVSRFIGGLAANGGTLLEVPLAGIACSFMCDAIYFGAQLVDIPRSSPFSRACPHHHDERDSGVHFDPDQFSPE
jgi:hypothetical protein